MGAPMNAFVRVDSKPVRLRSQIYEPNYLLIVDHTIMRGFNCFSGLKEDGIAIINGKGDAVTVPKLKAKQKVFIVPASDIALKYIGRPLGNTAMLGAFCAATNELTLDDLNAAIKHRFSAKLQEANIKAAQEGFESVTHKTKEKVR
ncbi:MAG: pyruvate ferredoxin oxidoreductase [Candidatus Omnitrophica bacterium CG23_combo_of_CG06-09_8_20_14_all_41_10]|uniref:Pyruvate ferredoxin oxidoreductase n=1 Tax=Candidatus Sherwoodlollariibacterium unditelluris TaxID=1974757 RepID=A0A2G9YJ86_9BACT|nr:MAG: pyruvate ferredoxin oxidoreductase [Candidatus Omnitrophica bacterium CG23_combo_of_CG06-09_8_20_14_all_41_10]